MYRYKRNKFKCNNTQSLRAHILAGTMMQKDASGNWPQSFPENDTHVDHADNGDVVISYLAQYPDGQVILNCDRFV